MFLNILRYGFTFLLVLAAEQSISKMKIYQIDSNHTYPSFEADHMGGLSFWRGKINSTSGEIRLDKKASLGSVEVTMDMATIDFGHDKMNDHAKNEDMFDVKKFPTATFRGRLVDFIDQTPTRVEGQLTLHGVTKPLTLEIVKFKCMFHPFKMREACGADARGVIMRDEFGIDYAKMMGFDMRVELRISVEAILSGNAE
jgi:polyisoprenoid-binding protein YceI|tara:strand:+ start:757 stop:1353 length:597 start_codon:yes stop_codon:yes gene_type:complete